MITATVTHGRGGLVCGAEEKTHQHAAALAGRFRTRGLPLHAVHIQCVYLRTALPLPRYICIYCRCATVRRCPETTFCLITSAFIRFSTNTLTHGDDLTLALQHRIVRSLRESLIAFPPCRFAVINVVFFFHTSR